MYISLCIFWSLTLWKGIPKIGKRTSPKEELGIPEYNVKSLTSTTFEFCTMCIYYLFNNKTKIVTKPSKQNTNSILIKLGVKHAPCTLLGLPMGQEQSDRKRMNVRSLTSGEGSRFQRIPAMTHFMKMGETIDILINCQINKYKWI